jgi:hypothetical protein
MISGHIAAVNGQQNTYTGFEEDQTDPNLQACVNVNNTLQTDSSTNIKTGLAVEERFVETEKIQINSDISVQVSTEKKQQWTRYWLADQEYVVAQNKDGRFAFDLVERIIGGDVDMITFDIISIIDDHPGQWMGSFGDRSSNVSSGTLYGEDIEDDTEIGAAYSNSNKSIIGVRMRYNNDSVMLRVGDSWFQILSPDYNRQQYLSFFEDRMLNYVT